MLIKFEQEILKLYEQGKIPSLLHLCGGNEDQLKKIFKSVKKGDWIFSTHRSHYHYLLSGGSPTKLKQNILNGHSMFIFDKKLNFFTSSIVAGTPCIAAGVAWSLKNEGSKARVWCFVGDGAEDEGHFYEAVRFVDGNKLPCKFIIEDNDRSVCSSNSDRGKKPFKWPTCVIKYKFKPTFPHAGSGSKTMIKFQEQAIQRCLKNQV